MRAASPGSRFHEIKQILREQKLHTVCEEASCPNIGECFGKGTATFMILGDICTRRCPFCDVAHGRPLAPDAEEPRHLAETIATLKLSYVVITSVDRDDLKDGGAQHFVDCIRAVRETSPATTDRSPGAGFPRAPRARAGSPLRGAARRDEPQPRDRAAPVPAGAPRRRLRAFAGIIRFLQKEQSWNPDQVRPDGRTGRNRRGNPRRDARPARARRGHAHHRPVPAALVRITCRWSATCIPTPSPCSSARPRRWDSGTRRSARWSALPTTPTSRPIRRAWTNGPPSRPSPTRRRSPRPRLSTPSAAGLRP